MAKCTRCGAKAGLWMSMCDACIKAGQEKSARSAAQTRLVVSGAGDTAPSQAGYGQGAIDVLRVFAWLNLLGGVIVSIYVWSTLATFDASGRFGSYHESNPLGVILGIASLTEGVFGCALLLVICSMAENLVAIRKATVSATDSVALENG